MTRRAACAALALWSVVAPVAAFCPYPTPKACSRFFESDAVFVATVLSRGYVDDDEFIRFDVRVSRSLRGTVGDTAAVYTGNDSARLQWEVGKDYVVFARHEDGRLWSGNDCGPLSDSERVQETIREIEALSDVATSSIEGEIRSAPQGPGLAAVKVRIEGESESYETETDSAGHFRINLPPGQYRVQPGPEYRQSDYSWYDLDDIKLTGGQCAQVQLVPR